MVSNSKLFIVCLYGKNSIGHISEKDPFWPVAKTFKDFLRFSKRLLEKCAIYYFTIYSSNIPIPSLYCKQTIIKGGNYA